MHIHTYIHIYIYKYICVCVCEREREILASRILCCGCNRQIHTDYRNPVEKRGLRGHCKSERGPETPLPPPPGQAFIVFLGPLYQGWSSFTMHRFVLGGYLLQTTKERMLLNTSKKDICKCKGKSGRTRLHYTLGWFSTGFRKLKTLRKHLLPQFRVREF